MMCSFENLTKSDQVIFRTTLLLRAAVVCDNLEMAGIPAILKHDGPELVPQEINIFCDEFMVSVPAEYVSHASQLLN